LIGCSPVNATFEAFFFLLLWNRQPWSDLRWYAKSSLLLLPTIVAFELQCTSRTILKVGHQVQLSLDHIHPRAGRPSIFIPWICGS
jgi:hypothetical protein